MIAYVDCRRGISGSSLLSALVDAGADLDDVAARLAFLSTQDPKLRADEVVVDGLRACSMQVDVADARVADGPADLIAKLADGGLPAAVREQAADVYRRLAAAEARVHGVEPDAVRFEELATLRSVVGVVGTLIALGRLDIDVLTASPIPFGGGETTTHHGRVPLPAPATLELLRGMPVEPQTGSGELVTPTGVALLASCATSFGEIPPMTIEAVGRGFAATAGDAIVTRIVLGTL